MQEAADEAAAQLRKNELLILAASTGFRKDVASLIADGADVNCKDKEGTPLLHFPSAKGYIDILKLLLSKGADVDSEDPMGQTALHFAAEENSYDVVKHLIKSKAWIDAYDSNEDTALHLATRKGHMETVKRLLMSGAKTEIANRRSLTPLGESIVMQKPEILELLIEKGANTSHLSKGYSPLHLAVGIGNEAIVALLLKHVRTGNLTHSDNVTPLHCAARKSVPLSIIRLLIKHGCEVTSVDSQDKKPLDWAKEEGVDDKEIIKTLSIGDRRRASRRRRSLVTEIEPEDGPEDEWKSFQNMAYEEKLKQVEVWARSKEAYLNELVFLDRDSRRAVAMVGKFMRAAECKAAVERLREDHSFQRDALDPHVQKAVAECTEHPRNLHKYTSDTKIMGVLIKLKRLQEILKRNGRMKIVYEELLNSTGSTDRTQTEEDMSTGDLETALASAKEAVVKAVLGGGGPIISIDASSKLYVLGTAAGRKSEEGTNWWSSDQKANGETSSEKTTMKSGTLVKTMLYQFLWQLLLALLFLGIMVGGMYLTDSFPAPSNSRPTIGAPGPAIVTNDRNFMQSLNRGYNVRGEL